VCVRTCVGPNLALLVIVAGPESRSVDGSTWSARDVVGKATTGAPEPKWWGGGQEWKGIIIPRVPIVFRGAALVLRNDGFKRLREIPEQNTRRKNANNAECPKKIHPISVNYKSVFPKLFLLNAPFDVQKSHTAP